MTTTESASASFLPISYPRTVLGQVLSKEQDEGRGVKLFTKGGILLPLIGVMQVCIISCIKDAKDKRAEILRRTIANYTGEVRWDIFILVPRDLVAVYDVILKDLPVQLVAYEIHETMLTKMHKFFRFRNVGDARNASLALGVALRLKKLLVSDDDRCYIAPFFNHRFRINKGKHYWCNPENNSFTDAKAFNQFKEHCDNLFAKHEKLAILGFSSYNRRRCWKGQIDKEKVPMIFSQGNQHCAQLVLLNIELLNQQEITYLPIRMGEDTAFQYMLMDKGFECLETSHLAHNSPPVSACASIARGKRNAFLKNYSDRDIFYLKQFFNCGCVIRKGRQNVEKFYFRIRWCPNGSEVSMPNFIAANSKQSIKDKLDAYNKVAEEFRKELQKSIKGKPNNVENLLKEFEKDPRLSDEEDPMDKKFDFKEFLQRELDDESSGWQMMGELLHQMLLAGHIQRDLKSLSKPKQTPKVQTPKVQTPKVQKPKVEKPKVQKPKVQKPKVEKPKVEKPKGEKPKVEKPKVEKPKVEKLKKEEGVRMKITRKKKTT